MLVSGFPRLMQSYTPFLLAFLKMINIASALTSGLLGSSSFLLRSALRLGIDTISYTTECIWPTALHSNILLIIEYSLSSFTKGWESPLSG